MLPRQFRDNAPSQLRNSYGMKMMPLFPRQHNSPKRKGGNKSHFLGRLIRSLGVPKERGVWNSQGGRTDKLFCPSLHCLGLYNNNVSCLRTVSGLNLVANPVILICKLWDQVWSLQFSSVQFSRSVAQSCQLFATP